MLVCECAPDKILAKRFLADGTKIDFAAGRMFQFEEHPIEGWEDLVGMFTELSADPRRCILRGALVEGYPRGPGWYRRLKKDDAETGEPANIESVPVQWVVYDFDDTVAPFDVAEPEKSIRAWHATLPAELRCACGAFFPSASAHVSATVRGKLVTWYRKPVSEKLARAYAIHYGADASVASANQPNYFAAPIFEGCTDPLEGKRTPIMFSGPPAVPPPREALKRTRERPAPVTVGQLPTGDKGILASLGRQEALVGARFQLAGKLGGLMRKLGFEKEDCAAILRAWLPAADLAPREAWALGAWDLPPSEVSGLNGLIEIVGSAHAQVIYTACLAARRPVRIGVAK